MSRRERHDRDSDSRRHRSGFDREPSPKRSRRDGKPETERVPSNNNLDSGDQKNRRRLQDAVPLETPLAVESKVESSVVNKEFDKKPEGNLERAKNNSDPAEVPRSRSYFQHDERSNAGQVRRSFGRRATDEHLKDSKDGQREGEKNKSATYDLHRRERPQDKGDDNNVWRHDGFFKMESEPTPPARKRPAFREKKILVDSEDTDKSAAEPARPGRSGYSMPASERRERDRKSHHFHRSERPAAGDKAEAPRSGFPPRESYGIGGGNHKGRDRFSGRQSYTPGGTRGEKWKHDLFEEADSPTKNNEEDQIAKVEALLGS